MSLSKTAHLFSLFKMSFLTRLPSKSIWHIHLCSLGEFLSKVAKQFCVSDPGVCWAKDSTQHVQGRPGIRLSPWRRWEPTMHRLVPGTRHMAESSLRNTPAKCLRTHFHSSVCCCLCRRGGKGVSTLQLILLYIRIDFVTHCCFGEINWMKIWGGPNLICQT